MSVQAIQFGNLSAIRAIQAQKPIVPREVAQNFQTNYSNSELVPKVQNEVLANKLNIFA